MGSIRTKLRTFGALLRCEWGSHRWTIGLLLATCVTGLLGAFWLFDVPATAASAEGLRTAFLLALVVAVPAVADVFASGERTGQARLLRALPTRASAVVLAKIALLTCVVALATLAMVVTESLAAEIAALAKGSTLPLHDLLDHSPRGSRVDLTWLFATGVLIVTAGFAVVGRNALLATVAGVIVTAGFGALVARMAETPTLHGLVAVVVAAAVLLLNPLSLAVIGGTVLATAAPRGRLVRSAWLRGGLILGIPLSVATTAAGGVVLVTGLEGVPPFDEPEGDVMYVEMTPDGEHVALTLLQPQGITQQSSVWIADTEALDFVRVAEVSPGRWSTGLQGKDLSLAGWRADDDRLLLMSIDRWSGWADGRNLAVDPWTGASERISYEELRAHSEFGGVFIERRRDGGGRRLVHAWTGDAVDIGSAWPKVPEIARDAVFYTDPARALHRVDLATGSDEIVETDFAEKGKFTIGPYGTHAVAHDRDGSRIVELGTGRSRRIAPGGGKWARQEGVYLARGPNWTPGWTLVSVERDVHLPLERDVQYLHELPDGRWLGQDLGNDSLFLFNADGTLERTVRVGRGGE